MIIEKHSFKRVDFTDSLFYQDPPEAVENPLPKDPDSGNEADAELEREEECL